MRGQLDLQSSMFHYFSPESRVPADHPLRRVKKLADRGELKDGEKVVVYITGEGLKTLDANRDSFALTEIDPNPDSFETHFGQEVVA